MWKDNLRNAMSKNGILAEGSTLPDNNPDWEDYFRAACTPTGIKISGASQKKEMPDPTTTEAGKIVQYVGETTANFTNGYFYKNVNNAWTRVNVQPAGAGGEVVWGDITGSLSSQTDLSNALEDKADKSTTYTKTEVDTALSAKQGTLTAGTNITIDENNVISATGSGGTTDYSALTNKPSINSVALNGNKTLNDLGIQAITTITNHTLFI